MKGSGKIFGIIFGIILIGATASTTLGYLVNLTDISGLPTWASTLMLLGGIFALIKVLMPSK